MEKSELNNLNEPYCNDYEKFRKFINAVSSESLHYVFNNPIWQGELTRIQMASNHLRLIINSGYMQINEDSTGNIIIPNQVHCNNQSGISSFSHADDPDE